jgi:hypothetical protein
MDRDKWAFKTVIEKSIVDAADGTFVFTLKSNGQQPVSYWSTNIHKERNGKKLGTGLTLHTRELTNLKNDLYILATTSDVTFAEKEDKYGRRVRINRHYDSKGNRYFMIKLDAPSKETQYLNVPADLALEFTGILGAFRNIMSTRSSTDQNELKRTDILKYFARKYKGKYAEDPSKFVADFGEEYVKLGSAFGIEGVSSNDLEATPFKERMLDPGAVLLEDASLDALLK